MDEIEKFNIIKKLMNMDDKELVKLCEDISSDELSETEEDEEETETEEDEADVTESEEDLFSDEEQFMQRKKARYI